MSAKKLGQVIEENCVVMVCDLQERFAPSIAYVNTEAPTVETAVSAYYWCSEVCTDSEC